MKTPRYILSRIAAITVVCASLLPTVHAAVPGMKIIKLYSPTPGANHRFGKASILAGSYAFVGEPGDTSGIAGAVHVYNAATGAFVRTMKPTVSALNDGFGAALATDGVRLLVRANPGAGSSVYLMEATTGKQVRRFVADAGQNDTAFGYRMVLTDRYAIIASSNENSNQGAVYVFDLNSTNPPTRITAADGAAGDRLGDAVYRSGSILLIGAPYHGGKGAVYRYDLSTGLMLGKIQPVGIDTGDNFGHTVVGGGNSAFVSAPYDNTAAGSAAGSVYSLGLDGSVKEGPFTLDPSPAANRSFGSPAWQYGNLVIWNVGQDLVLADAVRRDRVMTITHEQIGAEDSADDSSLLSGRLLLGYGSDSALASSAGAACIIQSVPTPLPAVVVATRNDSAPGAAGIAFNDLNNAAINRYGFVMAASSLSGTGSNAGKDSGVFDDLVTSDLLELAAKSRDDLGGGVKISSVSSPLMNDNEGLFQAALTGTGVTSSNNRAILRDDGTAVTPLLRTGQTMSLFSGATLSGIGQMAQSDQSDYFTSVLTLKTGVGGTTAANDSGIAFVSTVDGSITTPEREGLASPIAGVNYGQFLPRVAYANSVCVFSTMLSGPATENQGLFYNGVNAPANMLARKGSPAPDITGAVFSSFLGENADANGYKVFRATISGPGVTTANNQGLWLNDTGTAKLIARTGLPAPGFKISTGVVWSSFLQVCAQQGRIIIRGLLRGPGITTANDEIVVLYQEDGSFLTLQREGDTAPNCEGAKIGSIIRMEAANYGQYRMLVNLAGASASNNLALLGGNTENASVAEASTLRRPALLLRKGTLISTSNLGARARITSLAFANTQTQDTTSMGCKGLPSVTGGGGTLIKLTLSDGTTQIVKAE